MWGFESLRPHQNPPGSILHSGQPQFGCQHRAGPVFDDVKSYKKVGSQMQIVETSNEGLKRAYALTIAATDIAARVEGEVKKIAPQVAYARLPPRQGARQPRAQDAWPCAAPSGSAGNLDHAKRWTSWLPTTAPAPRHCSPMFRWAKAMRSVKTSKLTVSLEVLPKSRRLRLMASSWKA